VLAWGNSGEARADTTLDEAQRHFYNARYPAAVEITLALQALPPERRPSELAIIELRTSALHFQVRRALGSAADKDKALKACTACEPLMKSFFADIARGQALARTRLKTDPVDEETLFYLGKIDLNYVWLQLGTLGRRTGWDQYWEARKSLDTVLKRNPQHVRARVARAWIDYIVDTRMPRGTKWLLGGGNRKRALAAVREAAAAPTDFFTHAEAEFALWDMLVREKARDQAAVVARRLALDFPDNAEVTSFLMAHQ
jgi:hypothetical protein